MQKTFFNQRISWIEKGFSWQEKPFEKVPIEKFKRIFLINIFLP
jgi:hypothetical protein